jgi:protein-S-isoprenylcysteine O-methyltransferase Ste14
MRRERDLADVVILVRAKRGSATAHRAPAANPVLRTPPWPRAKAASTPARFGNFAAVMHQSRNRALELKLPPGILFLFIALLMWLAGEFAPTFDFQVPFQLIIAWVFVLTGLAICAIAVAEFRRARTTVNPIKPGSSATLVTRGVYQRTRNPMYLGFLLVFVGVAIATGNLLAFLYLPLFVLYMNEFQIKPEERALGAKFGAEFERYKAAVRRWI